MQYNLVSTQRLVLKGDAKDSLRLSMLSESFLHKPESDVGGANSGGRSSAGRCLFLVRKCAFAGIETRESGDLSVCLFCISGRVVKK